MTDELRPAEGGEDVEGHQRAYEDVEATDEERAADDVQGHQRML